MWPVRNRSTSCDGAADDVLERPARARAVVEPSVRPDAASRPRAAARRSPCTPAALELARVAVGGLRLVEEAAGCAMPDGGTMSGVPSSVMPMKPIFTPPMLRIAYGGKQRLAGASVLTTLAARNRKSRARERRAVGAAVGRVAAAALHALQLRRALVELVVADRVEVEPDARSSPRSSARRGTAPTAAGCAPIRSPAATTSVFALRRLSIADVRRRGTRRRPPGRGRARRSGSRLIRPERRRLEVAVEVVDRQQLDLDGLGGRLLLAASAAAGEPSRAPRAAPAGEGLTYGTRRERPDA